MNDTFPETPELDRMKEIHDESQPIGEFLDYTDYTLCEWDDDTERFWPVQKSIESILAEYFDIDLNKVEKERMAILDFIRSQQS